MIGGPVARPAQVVVAGHEDLDAPQRRHVGGQRGCPAAHRQVAKDPHLVTVSDEVVPTLHEGATHRRLVAERSAAVADDVGVAEVEIRCPPAHQRHATGADQRRQQASPVALVTQSCGVTYESDQSDSLVRIGICGREQPGLRPTVT